MPTLHEMKCKNMGIKSLMDNIVGALNQATKAIAMARGFVANKGRDLVVRPGFGDTTIDGEERTLIKQFVSII
jgi:stage V sporulation protein SpoVS